MEGGGEEREEKALRERGVVDLSVEEEEEENVDTKVTDRGSKKVWREEREGGYEGEGGGDAGV